MLLDEHATATGHAFERHSLYTLRYKMTSVCCV